MKRRWHAIAHMRPETLRIVLFSLAGAPTIAVSAAPWSEGAAGRNAQAMLDARCRLAA